MGGELSKQVRPGPVVLFGSGETSASGRKVFDRALRKLPHAPRLALLETPAGFELNSDRVIGRVAEFIGHRLQNYDPQLKVIPARKRGTDFSPDDPEIVAPLLESDLIFMGPGSPSYAVRQLQDSLAWHYLVARHRLGATLVLASAATIAISAYALPVYEIYKVGEDLHWKDGLDFFGPYGLPLVFIPHWNNQEGGEELDTSRCFMGRVRFAALMKMLPADLTVVGVDEHTALIMDPQAGDCHVIGAGGVTLIHTGPEHGDETPDLHASGLDVVAEARSAHVHQYQSGDVFPLSECCPFDTLVSPQQDLPANVWQRALAVQKQVQVGRKAPEEPPSDVLALVQQREEARASRDWDKADELRQQITELGWEIQDTPDGPKLNVISEL
jgi:cyanophycinase-like exopeptidase